MSVGEVKLKWSKDEDGWNGLLFPVFAIYKDGKQLYLDIMELDRAVKNQHRHIKVDSIHQGKCIASKIFKMALPAKGGDNA